MLFSFKRFADCVCLSLLDELDEELEDEHEDDELGGVKFKLDAGLLTFCGTGVDAIDGKIEFIDSGAFTTL